VAEAAAGLEVEAAVGMVVEAAAGLEVEAAVAVDLAWSMLLPLPPLPTRRTA